MLVELPAAFANGAKTVDGTAVQVQKIGDTVKLRRSTVLWSQFL
mgnify:CR=1 FL=1